LPHEDIIILNQLRYHGEIRSVKEVDVTRKLIDQLTATT
jgi:hypothetical protein